MDRPQLATERVPLQKMSPKPPLKRRLRARGIEALVRTLGWLPSATLEKSARPLARLAVRRQFARTVEANVRAAEPWLMAHAPDVAERMRDLPRFQRDVADFTALQATQWLRLARGAGPDDRRGAWVDQLVELDPSIELFDAALARGRGVIVVTAHIGNWELLCARLRRRGTPGAVVGRVRRNDPSHSWLGKMRSAYGVLTLPQDGSPREMLRILRDGGVLGLLTDLRARRVDSTPLPLLGVDVETMSAAASFARASSAPILPVRCVQRPTGRFQLSVEPELAFDEQLDRHEAARALLLEQNRTFERWIVDTPEQWAWHQERLAPQKT